MLLSATRGQAVRLNEEDCGLRQVKVERPVSTGDPISISDLQEVIAFDLEEFYVRFMVH